MAKRLCILGWFVFLVLLCLSVGILVFNYIQAKQIDSWLVRAKDAGNPAQVAEFLSNYRDALIDNNKVDGRYSSVQNYPGTYMPVYIRTTEGLINRANALAIQQPTETSYQMGLVNLEKDLGDMEAVAFAVWFANWNWIWMALVVLSGISIVVVGLGLICSSV